MFKGLNEDLLQEIGMFLACGDMSFSHDGANRLQEVPPAFRGAEAAYVSSTSGIFTLWSTSHMLIHRLCAWLGSFVRSFVTPDDLSPQAYFKFSSTLQAWAPDHTLSGVSIYVTRGRAALP